MAAMFSAERANQKKKANACLISHIEKKMKKKSLKHCIDIVYVCK